MSEKKALSSVLMRDFKEDVTKVIMEDFMNQRKEARDQIVKYLKEAIKDLEKAKEACNNPVTAFDEKPKKDIDAIIQQVEKIISAKDDFWQHQK